jgi:hypothetical protein
MPGQFFNFSRYFKKNPSSGATGQNQTDQPTDMDESVTGANTITTTTRPWKRAKTAKRAAMID